MTKMQKVVVKEYEDPLSGMRTQIWYEISCIGFVLHGLLLCQLPEACVSVKELNVLDRACS